MPRKSDNGIPLSGKRVTDADAMDLAIKARARAKILEVDNKALQKDRDALLVEFEDYRNSQHQPPRQKPPKAKARPNKVRVTVGDLHGMRMDRAAVDAFLGDLQEWQPDEILLGGDMVEAGGWIAKHQPIGFQSQADYTYQEDIEAAAWFLDEVQTCAPRAVIKYLEGNHEDKVERLILDMVNTNQRDAEFMMQAFAPKSLLQLETRGIEYFGRHEVHEEGLPPGWIRWGKILYTHELGAGKNAARSALLSSAANIVFFHTHQFDESAINLPGVGLVKAWNSGCLCETQPMWRHSNPTGWNHGYGVEFIEENGDFLRIHVPIWQGRSFAETMIGRMKS